MIKVRVIIEILGSPKEHVEEIINKVVKKIETEETDIKLLNGKSYEATEVKGLWSTFAELELEFNNLYDLIGFSFDYMPSVIEILEPEKIDIGMGDVNELLNDLLAKLHNYDMVTKNLSAENILLKRQLEKK